MIQKSELFWKKIGDEAEVVQCPFKIKLFESPFQMYIFIKYCIKPGKWHHIEISLPKVQTCPFTLH